MTKHISSNTSSVCHKLSPSMLLVAQVFYRTLFPFLPQNLVGCQILYCSVSIFAPSLSLSPSTCHTVYSCAGSVKARTLTAERERHTHIVRAREVEQKACECPGSMVECWTLALAINLSLSYILSGTNGSWQWQPVTDD